MLFGCNHAYTIGDQVLFPVRVELVVGGLAGAHTATKVGACCPGRMPEQVLCHLTHKLAESGGVRVWAGVGGQVAVRVCRAAGVDKSTCRAPAFPRPVTQRNRKRTGRA